MNTRDRRLDRQTGTPCHGSQVVQIELKQGCYGSVTLRGIGRHFPDNRESGFQRMVIVRIGTTTVAIRDYEMPVPVGVGNVCRMGVIPFRAVIPDEVIGEERIPVQVGKRKRMRMQNRQWSMP